MKLLHRILSLASCVALLAALAPAAHAASVSGSFWTYPSSGITPCVPAIDGTCTGTQGAVPATLPPASPATATFTLTNSNPLNLLNFYSATDSDLTGFLTTGCNSLSAAPCSPSPNGNTVAYTTGSNVTGTNVLNDALFEFTGTTTLSTGQVITMKHDDGALLYLNGVLVINSGAPTSSGLDSYTVTSALAGTDSFVLWYAETNGAPADLNTNLVTPEPDSIVLLGSGLLAAAGMIRRRITA